MDPKVMYIAKTLSRTKRKDYENYVVNAIWNRLNDPRLVPVAQQYVKGKDGKYYFIDLYFPQLKIGIECDEGYHGAREQKAPDLERELTISDILKQVDGREYLPLHVDVTKSFAEVEAQINEHVETIRKKMRELTPKDEGKLIALCGAARDGANEENGKRKIESEIEAYFREKEYLTLNDDIVFPDNKAVYNIILGQNYSYSLRHGGELFHKLYTEYGYEEGTFPWFPKLTIRKPTRKGYYNVISNDASEIYERLDSPEKNAKRKEEMRYIGKKRVVFAQVKDPVTGVFGYRFVGVFIGDHYDAKGTITYKRISDRFKIIKKTK